jgi:hypothetical protein
VTVRAPIVDTTVVAIDARCRAAWPSLPAALPVGAVFVTDAAEALRVVDGGRIDPIGPGLITKEALRLARVPAEDFEQAVESANPPTITALADRGKLPRRRWMAPSRVARRIPAGIPREARESLPAFARFLANRLTSADREKLGRLLLGPKAVL